MVFSLNILVFPLRLSKSSSILDKTHKPCKKEEIKKEKGVERFFSLLNGGVGSLLLVVVFLPASPEDDEKDQEEDDDDDQEETAPE